MNASVAFLAAAAVLGLLMLLAAASFNRFVRERNHVRESWSNVDTELRRRHDLIPNLVETVTGYAAHERSTLEAVVRARAAAAEDLRRPGAKAETEQGLVRSLRELLAVAERYPALVANERFADLQAQLVETEDRIQLARRIYNANVRDLNRRVQSFPSNVVATLFGIRESDYFDVEATLRAGPAPRAQVGFAG